MKFLTGTYYRMLVLLTLAAAPCAHAADAGRIQFLTGTVQLTTAAGKTHQLMKGDPVQEGDTVVTAPGSAAQIQMADGGLIAVRAESRLRIDSFKFSGKQDGSEQSYFSLAKGGFRAVTGLIGRINKPAYRVTTPSATIGIRGTDHEVIVVAPGSTLAATAPAGTYDKVNKGETALANDKGSVAILPNQMGFAAAGEAPQLQPLNLKLFTVPPPLQAKAGRLGEGIRDSAVVDAALLDPTFALAFSLPAGLNFARIPITASYTYTPFSLVAVLPPVTKTVTF